MTSHRMATRRVLGGVRAIGRWGWCLALGSLGACASYGPRDWPPGTPRSEVVKAMGAPTVERGPTRDAAPGTVRRLVYARGPMGHHTYMLDFDADQRLLAATQVLTSSRFSQVQPGMQRQDLLDLLGPPTDVRSFPRQREHVWAYRHENTMCLWFEISVSEAGRVTGTGEGPDPVCEKKLD
jgi:hypothetical protein